MREVIGLTLAAIAAVAAVLTVRELPPWLPMPSGEILAALFKLAIALLGAWLAIVIWGIRRRLDGEAATHAANDARLKSVEADLVAVKSEVALRRPKDELVYRGVLWAWDDVGRIALGPFCPTHKSTPLGYQVSSGHKIVYSDFEGNWLGGAGWLICPQDRQTFPDEHSEKVQDLRDAVENDFRGMRGIPPKPKRPLSPDDLAQLDVATKFLERLGGGAKGQTREFFGTSSFGTPQPQQPPDVPPTPPSDAAKT
jgi:hypothetical protein